MRYIPKISVILPFYNAENTLVYAIKSIAMQTFSDFECILVNNNSSDTSVHIAEKWCKRDKRFRLYHERRQGVIHAGNTAAFNSSGSFIARMDADDFAFPNRLRVQYEYLTNNPDCDVIAGCVNYVSHKEKLGGFDRFVNWNNDLTTYEQIFVSRFIELPVINPTLMWRKEVSDKYGLYKDGDFPEDYEMLLRWLECGIVVEKLKDVVLSWHDSDNRLSRTDSRYTDEAFFRIKTLYLVNWLKQNNPSYPDVAIWGASRISRKRIKELFKHGVRVKYYIDIRENRSLDKKVVFYQDIPPVGTDFILVYMKHVTIRNEIREFLNKRGYKEGINYILVS